MSVHPTAIVDPSVVIGKDVVIGPYVTVGPGVALGDGCRLSSHNVIEYTELGNECLLYPYASLGLAPQHLGYKNEPTKLVVGKRTVFREGVTAHRGSLFDQGVTRIGDDCYFMAYSHIAHDCVVGNSVILANAAQLAGHVHVGDRAFISSMVGIHQFVRIGSGAMVSGGAMVPLDVAPFCIAQGDRAEIRGINLVGCKRAGFSRDSIRLLKNAYKTIFLSGLFLSEALQHEAMHVDDPWIQIFKKFFEVPKRGFLRPSELAIKSEAEVEAI
jgi:UDP-N-acetylglucosamine acyltransferase